MIRTVHGVHVHDGEHRRNIVTRGLALRELEGTRLRIGDVLLEYDRRRRVKARTRELRYYVAARLLT